MRLTFLYSLLLCSIFACNKDDDYTAPACTALAGEWTGISWMEDGMQFLGDSIFITRSELNLSPMSGGEGELQWHLDYILGGPEDITGTYSVNTTCNEITITPKPGGVSSTYRVDIHGTRLTLSGYINDVQIEMKFDRN
jgi:hypothetical protein